MASVKRPRSTSQEHLPAEGITPFAANSIQTDLKAQISTSQGFKSPRTKTQTSPTARTVQAHPYNNSHIPQQSPAELDISMSAFTAGPSSSSNPNHINASAPFVSSVQPPSSLHNGFDSTSVLSSGLSSPAASPPSPDHSPLDLGAGAARVMGFGEFFNPQPQQIVSSKNNTTSGATGPPLPHQPAWSTYTSPSPHAYAHAQFGPPSGGSGSSYRGSMDDSLGLGAGYGLPNSALAGLGLESNSPLGFAAVSDASMPPPAPPSISLSSVGQPQNIAAPAGPPPAHPPPEPPTVSAPTASLAQLPQPVSPATPSSAQHQSWNSFSPLAMGFRETRKGQDLGLGLEDFEVIETLGQNSLSLFSHSRAALTRSAHRYWNIWPRILVSLAALEYSKCSSVLCDESALESRSRSVKTDPAHQF